MNPACHQLLRESVTWCHKVSGRLCDPCLFGDITQLLGEHWFDVGMSYSSKLQAGRQADLSTVRPCAFHGCDCSTEKMVTFDVSGLPCPDMSQAGKRRKRARPTNTVYIAHGRWVTERETPLLLVECIKEARPKYNFTAVFPNTLILTVWLTSLSIVQIQTNE